MGISVGCLVIALVLSAPAAPGQAAPSEDPASEEEPAGASDEGKELTGASPAQLVPRLELRHQFASPEGGGHLHTTTLRVDTLFLRRALLRFDLPWATLEKADVRRLGYGDIRLLALALLTTGPRQATILSAGLLLDTATRPVLGTGKDVVIVGAVGAFKPRRWWLLYGIVEQQLSFAGDDARPDVNRLLTNVGSIVFGPRRDWYTLDLSPEADFEAGSDAPVRRARDWTPDERPGRSVRSRRHAAAGAATDQLLAGSGGAVPVLPVTTAALAALPDQGHSPCR